jgi:hypothetical protein
MPGSPLIHLHNHPICILRRSLLDPRVDLLIHGQLKHLASVLGRADSRPANEHARGDQPRRRGRVAEAPPGHRLERSAHLCGGVEGTRSGASNRTISGYFPDVKTDNVDAEAAGKVGCTCIPLSMTPYTQSSQDFSHSSWPNRYPRRGNVRISP